MSKEMALKVMSNMIFGWKQRQFPIKYVSDLVKYEEEGILKELGPYDAIYTYKKNIPIKTIQKYLKNDFLKHLPLATVYYLDQEKIDIDDFIDDLDDEDMLNMFRSWTNSELTYKDEIVSRIKEGQDNGKFNYLDEIMGCYRIHNTGLSVKHNGYFKAFSMIFIYQNFNIYTNFKYDDKIKEEMIYEVRRYLPEAIELNKLKANFNIHKPSLLSRIINKLKKVL